MIAGAISVQLLALLSGICTTGSTRQCKLTGCDKPSQVCLVDRTWGPCSCDCTDGNACTTDTWTGTTCRHVPISSDDGNPCTLDGCNPTTGITHTPVAAGMSCSDGNVCNGLEACDGAGLCLAGTPLLIDDGNPCTDDGCDALAGVWHLAAAAGTSCTDGNACNGIETCDSSASCGWGQPPIVDDGDPCTADTCDPLLGVTHARILACVFMPPDPASLAPALSSSSVTSFADSVAFLFSPPQPIQFGVDPAVLDATRIAVVRGRVLATDGAPLGGVLVSILAHPEYGYTYARADGGFDLAVNGGGTVTINYSQAGFLPSQRAVQPIWNQYSEVPDVLLVPLDPVSTVVTLGLPTPQVATGSLVTDSAGTRQVRILIPANTQAGLSLPNQSSEPLSSMTLRVTEYTAGRLGESAMPGELPPASGYTYAIELGADEAVLANATDIQFDRPVSFYVDNFLRFPVGGAVPTGYYDRNKAQWLPSADGRVIKILAIADGIAQVDVDGSGAAADSAKLTSLGVTGDELQQLAQLYQPGRELWRARVTHFTPWDCNWPFACTGVCTSPYLVAPAPVTPDPCQHTTGGSIIECQGQVLGETIPVVGTTLTLHYQSDRTSAYGRTLEIPLTSAGPLDSTLLGINASVRVAGKVAQRSFVPPFIPNQTWTFVWDGKDAYGRTMMGRALADIRVDYVYEAVYSGPAGVWSFGAFSPTGTSISDTVPAVPPITLSQEFTAWVGTLDERSAGLGGWSLSVHDSYDPASSLLRLGTGGRRSAEDAAIGVETIAGGGATYQLQGRPATEARLGATAGVVVAPDRSIYFIEQAPDYVIRRITPDGLLWTVSGTRPNCTALDEGVAATEACLGPMDIALGADGAIYVSDYQYASDNVTHLSRVFRIGSDGIVHIIAGVGPAGFTGDGGPATQAQIERVNGLAFGPDGSLYLLSWSRLRRIDPSGVITTVAGNGSCTASAGDNGPAILARFCAQGQIAVGRDGSVFVPDTMNRRLRKITPDGIIRTIAGPGSLTEPGDGGPALNAGLAFVYGIALDHEGSVFVGEDYYTSAARIRKISTSGTISTIGGGSSVGFAADPGAARTALFNGPRALAVQTDGTILVADMFNARLRAIHPPRVRAPAGLHYFPSEDAQRIMTFDGEGRHLETRDATTGVALYTFSYDASGWLSGVLDRDGLLTTIERDGSGTPVALVAPHGQRTSLSVDPNGYLATVTNPAGEAFSMTYDSLGLMRTFTDPGRRVHSFSFTDGRLTRDENPAGGVKELARSDAPGSYRVQVSTAFDATRTLVSLFDVERLASGERVQTNTAADGTQEVVRFDASGTMSALSPDGTASTSTPWPDPRFGLQAPLLSTTVTLPSGLQMTTSHTRAVALADESNLLSVTRQTDTATVNGRAWEAIREVSSRRKTVTTPEGRSTATVFDEKGRLVRVEPAGFPSRHATDISYGPSGEILAIARGARAATFSYFGTGEAQTITDPEWRTTAFTYDLAARVETISMPGGRTTGFAYDASGNLASLTPPERPPHAFTYTANDLTESYTPPSAPGTGLGSTSYGYLLNGALAQVLLPDSTTVVPGYDDAGRLASVTTARGTTSLGYDGAGRVQSVGTPENDWITFGYDGFLLTTATSTGSVPGVVSRTYDSDLRVATCSVNGSAVSYSYDGDGLLTGAGALIIGRDASTGEISGTTLAGTTTTQSYSEYGELSGFSASVGTMTPFSYSLTRDLNGRITGKSETVQGVTDEYVYVYDDAGRLATVSKNGVQTASYLFDANGNRTSVTTAAGTTIGTYDDQDRMATYGAVSYTYGPSGDLRTRTAGGQTTTYSYDALGNLLAAWLPEGRSIEYVIDGLNRRVGKRVNGVLVEGFLYDGQLRPVAWLDGAGQVYARFVYGLHVNVPEYMVTPAGTFRILTDHLGSPRLVVNASTGAVAQRLDYDEWGQVLADTSPGFQPFGFAGGLYDRDTVLVRFGARDYDPQTGRWTNKDPVRFAGGDTNLYVYAAIDPINRPDATGLWAIGINFDIDIIGPFLSGGGGSAGLNLVYSSDFGFGFYFYKPTPKPSEGFMVGASVQVCGGPGKGPWSGKFDNWGGGFGPLGGGYYESVAGAGEDPGYAGFYGSFGVGAPAGLAYSQTDYIPFFGK